jgi:hypothetical protein
MRPLWLLAALVLLACSSHSGGPVDPAVLAAIERFYEAVGREKGGRCQQLEMAILSSSVTDRSAESITLDVRYTYRDPQMRFPFWTNRQDPVTTGRWPKELAGECRGSGTRTFTVADRDGDYEVTAMTGARDDGITIEKVRNPSIFGGH